MTVIRVPTTEDGAEKPAFPTNTSTWQTLVYVYHTDAADPGVGGKLCMRINMSQFNIILMNVKLSLNKYCSYFFTLDLDIYEIFCRAFWIAVFVWFSLSSLVFQDSRIFFLSLKFGYRKIHTRVSNLYIL